VAEPRGDEEARPPMLIDRWLAPDMRQAVKDAVGAEADGYHGAWVPEMTVDPFLLGSLAAEHTVSIQVGLGVVVAFARSPMTVALSAWNIQEFSGGRLILGLGSQIRPHIENRYSMPWSRPAARMREFVQAMRAIWDTWQNGTRLSFDGVFYRHTLMTPFFSPGPIAAGPPEIYVAAVGPRMTAAAAEVADGLMLHSFCTPSYVRAVTLPILDTTFSRTGRRREHFKISQRVFVVTGTDEAELQVARDATRRQIAFYASTPAYRTVLEHHGWGELQTELNTLSKAGDWDAMPGLITDDLLGEFAVVAAPEEVAGRIRARVGGLVDRVSLYTPYELAPSLSATIAAGMKAGSARAE
jgi:probable F420-dependent oxidoreductase